MALGKIIDKLKKYHARLEAGQTRKIKPSHVERVLKKLNDREQNLIEDMAAARKPSKKQRIKRKLEETRKQIDRARWLKDKIS